MDQAKGPESLLARNAAVAVAYLVLAWLGKQMAMQPSAVAILWPPVGLSLAAVLLWGPRVWPGIWLGAAVQATVAFTPGLGPGGGVVIGTVFGVGAALQAVLGGWLVRRRGFRPAFDQVEDVFKLLVLGGLVACLVSASVGTAALVALGLEPAERALEAWRTWWLGDTLGAIFVAPVCLLASRLGVPSPISGWERAAWYLALAFTAYANARGWQPVPFLMVPLLVWAALRFTPARAVLAVAVVAMLLVLLTRLGIGPFVMPSHLETALVLQRFLASVAVPVLVLIAALAARERTEADLRESSLLLNAVVEHIPDTLFLKDLPSFRYRLINRAYERQVGFSREQVLGRLDGEIFPPSQAVTFETQDRQVVAGGGFLDIPLECVETPLGPRYYHTRKVVLADRAGQALHLLGVAEDLTELQSARGEIQHLNVQLAARVKELEAAYAELESFTYTVTHDLRAPVRSIDGFSQALLEGYAPHLDERGARWLGLIRGSAERLGHLIDDMLELSRVSRRELAPAEVDLSAMAEAIAAELAVAEPARRVEWRIEPGMVVRGDAGLLRIALTNLLGNAWKFTRRREVAHIAFQSRVREDGVREYEVTDDGAGFDMGYVDKLFKPFSRLHTEEEFEGTGIGLATVARVLQRHQGSVTAEGRPGEGATFRFTVHEAPGGLP